ncbi:MAG TPA: GAF domain-containing protein, partial [Candidatus Binatia bacterium]
MATKKPSKNKSLKLRARSVKTPAKEVQTIAELRQQLAEAAKELEDCKRQHLADVHELLQRETATREILALIARAPIDLPSILDAIAEKAASLCDAKDALIFRVDGDLHHRVAIYGSIPAPGVGLAGPNTRGTPVGRSIVDRRTIHIRDVVTDLETEFPEYKALQLATGTRSMLSTPLLRDGVPLGVIHIRRTEVQPFSEEQIKLLESFADQAVIALENARLFNELKESLEQQTATSEILGVIASSPTDIQPVLDAVAKNAAQLCEASDAQIRLVEGDGHRRVASFGAVPAPEFVRTTLGHPAGRAILNRKTVHV